MSVADRINDAFTLHTDWAKRSGRDTVRRIDLTDIPRFDISDAYAKGYQDHKYSRDDDPPCLLDTLDGSAIIMVH
jgi:hypothetical protein